jgi:hypothetical protein
MAQQRPGGGVRPDGVRRADAGEWARVALAACLLAVVAAGLRVAVPAPRLNGPFRHDALAIGAALEGVLACLLIALIIRGARAPREALLAAQLRKILRYVIVIGLAAIPLTYVLTRHVPPLRPIKPLKIYASQAPRLHATHPGGPAAGAIIVTVILGLLVAAAVFYVLVRLLRGRAWRGFRRMGPGLALGAEAGEDESDLREAVESGQSALRRFDDARAAIIACYVAMEDSLAQAGTARSVADTPDELLARAADRGLVRTGAAARLTGLFYEARFSSHPMPVVQRDEAEQALAELAGSLSDLESARAGTPAQAGAADGAGQANGGASG